jgi:methylenetetrahydrofolate reductase (NADPH)
LTGVFQRHNILKIGVGAYPQGIVGHIFGGSTVTPSVLDCSLAQKVEWAKGKGIALYAVTQFCLDTTALLAWLNGLTKAGIDVPIQVGVAGRCATKTLSRFVTLCSVPAPQSVDVDEDGNYTPLVQLDSIICRPDISGVHIFPFGGVEPTSTWLGKTDISLSDCKQAEFQIINQQNSRL